MRDIAEVCKCIHQQVPMEYMQSGEPINNNSSNNMLLFN